MIAITDDAAAPRPPLRAVRSGGLSALCAEAVEHEVTPEALWRHDALLEELMEERAILPVRYGTLVADDAAAERALAERRDELAAGLERVRGAVELALRVEERRPGPAGATGRDYLRAKAARMETARSLHAQLAELARADDKQPGRELLRAAYLVDRDAVADFVARVQRLQREHPELALLCTGPWPPYSFAEEGIER
jgi:hypothetical protein